ncbi:hypothetical protein PFISCL1PPCAC_1949, partial [Pristionchus fissidentatus]
ILIWLNIRVKWFGHSPFIILHSIQREQMAFRAKRIWAKGQGESEEIMLSNEKMHASGRFANVFAANLTKPTSKRVAVKRAWESKEAKAAGTEYKNEADVLAKLNHPNITRLLYYYVQKMEKETCHWMILDFLPLDMVSLKAKGVHLDGIDGRLYSYQLWSAVEHIHSKGYLHLDIKPANVIVDHDKGVLQLADFGNAKKFVDGEKHNPYQVTRFYRAPELLFGASTFTHGVDWWAAACVTAEFMLGRTLIRERTADTQMRLIIHILGYPAETDIKKMKVSRPRVSRPKEPRGLPSLLDADSPPELLSFLQASLLYSPDARITPANALKHALFKPLFSNPPPLRKNQTRVAVTLPNDNDESSSGSSSSGSSEEDDKKSTKTEVKV